MVPTNASSQGFCRQESIPHWTIEGVASQVASTRYHREATVANATSEMPACTQTTETADTHISHYNNVRCQLAATEVAGRISDVTAYTLANETRPDTSQ